MSEIYFNEPPTSGKVILYTSHGQIDIELWAKECPLASKNFIQLCLEGYYKNNIFHRIIKDFLIQTGDPTGTGIAGNDTIYGGHFKDEFHSRLKYRYRGLVGVANLGKGTNSNGNQFFITLSRADELNNSSTLFGKVIGCTIYNVIRISEVETNSKDVPLDPPFIKYTEVLINPFEGKLKLRILKDKSEKSDEEEVDESTSNQDALIIKVNPNLLSFGDDDDVFTQSSQQLEDVNDDTYHLKLKISSSHDLLDDSTLLKESSLNDHDNSNVDANDQSTRDSVRQRLTDLKRNLDCNISKPAKVRDVEESVVEEYINSKKEKRNAEISKLQNEILHFKKGLGSSAKLESVKNSIEEYDTLSEYNKRRELYLHGKRNTAKRKKESEVLANLEFFKERLNKILSSKQNHSNDSGNNPSTTSIDSSNSIFSDLDTPIDPSDTSWLKKGGLKFAVDSNRAYELDAARCSLEVFDPMQNDPKSQREFSKLKNSRLKDSLRRSGKSPDKW